MDTLFRFIGVRIIQECLWRLDCGIIELYSTDPTVVTSCHLSYELILPRNTFLPFDLLSLFVAVNVDAQSRQTFLFESCMNSNVLRIMLIFRRETELPLSRIFRLQCEQVMYVIFCKNQ